MGISKKKKHHPPQNIWNVLRVDGMQPAGKKLPVRWEVRDQSRIFGKGTINDPKVCPQFHLSDAGRRSGIAPWLIRAGT